jgi:hypothetical protein
MCAFLAMFKNTKIPIFFQKLHFYKYLTLAINKSSVDILQGIT